MSDTDGATSNQSIVRDEFTQLSTAATFESRGIASLPSRTRTRRPSQIAGRPSERRRTGISSFQGSGHDLKLSKSATPAGVSKSYNRPLQYSRTYWCMLTEVSKVSSVVHYPTGVKDRS